MQTVSFESLILMEFERGNISFSQLSKSLNLTKIETTKLLAKLDIPMTDYKLEEDLKGIESFLT